MTKLVRIPSPPLRARDGRRLRHGTAGGERRFRRLSAETDMRDETDERATRRTSRDRYLTRVAILVMFPGITLWLVGVLFG